MPGIVGCDISSGTRPEIFSGLEAMRYSSDYKQDQIFQDSSIICSRTHLNIIGEKISPIQRNDNLCWVEGEFYNIDVIREDLNLHSKTEGQILLEAYKKDVLESLLKKIDGLFISVIYDPFNKHLLFISDRYGIKPCYIWHSNNSIIWASELKALLSFTKFPRTIDKRNLECICTLGHFIGDESYFKETKLLPASSVWSYSLNDKSFIYKKRYWTWADVKLNKVSFNEAVEHAGHLFNKALAKSLNVVDDKLGLALSGGIDSRAVFAAMKMNSIEFKSITFGIKNCEDYLIAKKVSERGNVENVFFEINQNNWNKDRIKSIWKSDGLTNLVHFHASQFHQKIGNDFNIVYSGFAGNILMEGTFIERPNKRISNSVASTKFHGFSDLANPEDSFYDIEKENPYYLNNRLRRFTYTGLNEIKDFESRLPFIDNDFLEFVTSIDDEYLINKRFYKTLLLRSYNKYFKDIPRQGYGILISDNKFVNLIYHLKSQAFRRLGMTNKNMVEYNNWILPGQMKLIKDTLFSKDAILPELIDVNLNDQADNLINICKFYTIEVWLQLAINDKSIDSLDWK